MAIPFPTTRVQLLRETPTSLDVGYTAHGTPVAAHLSSPSGIATATAEGASTSVTFRLTADPCDMTTDMQVRDLGTGVVYDVEWCQHRPGPLPHVVAGLTATTTSR